MWSPGFESQAGPGQAAVDKVGPVLDFLQLVLDDADQALPLRGLASLRVRRQSSGGSGTVTCPMSTPIRATLWHRG